MSELVIGSATRTSLSTEFPQFRSGVSDTSPAPSFALNGCRTFTHQALDKGQCLVTPQTPLPLPLGLVVVVCFEHF